jgi:Chitobiase/beta-hexosaminidase C-terminal domain
MVRAKWYPAIFITITVLLAAIPAYARHKVGTLASSSYGLAGQQSTWDYAPATQITINGVTVGTEIVCQGFTQNPTPPNTCNSPFAFLYQIPSGPNNLVLTFSGLTNFSFDDSVNNPGFGVLYCVGEPPPDPADPPPPPAANNMLCTQNLNEQQIASLNIGWDALDGDLILTVPSIPAGDTLTFVITETGDFNGYVAPPTLNVSGAAIVPVTMNFGSADVGATGSQQTLTIANSGDFSSPLNISDLSISKDFAVAGSCSALNPGESCALSVAPQPTASGTLSGQIGFSDTSPVANESASLSGNGSTGNIALSPSSLVFGPTVDGFAQAMPVTVTNAPSNTVPFTVIGTSFTANPTTSEQDFTVGNSTCTAALAPGSSCTIEVEFAPSVAGVVQAVMTIADDSSAGSHVVTLQGNGVTVNTAAATPGGLAFAAQTAFSTSASQTITVNNAGSVALNILAVTTTAGFGVGSDGCSTAGALAPNATCTVAINFQPSSMGAFTGTVTIADDASGGTLVIPLSGTGLAAAAATPTFSVPGGAYNAAQTIALADSTPGATIYYTTDGSTPTASSTPYSTPITVSSTETIEAIATASGYTTSPLASATYSITYPAAAPTFSPAAGTYSSAQNVVISDSTAGATIYYTTDGTTPGTSSPKYTAPIQVSSSQTLKAVATAAGYVTSPVAAAQYMINLTPAGFAITGTAVTLTAGATTGNTSTITITPAGGFAGSVMLSATISSGPAGAVDVPTVSFGSSNPVNVAGSNGGTATLTITTTPSTSAAYGASEPPASARRAAGIMIFGAIMYIAMPANGRRRRSTSRLFALFFIFAAGIIACGGGGGGTGGGSTTQGSPGTTPGQYVITVTGTSGSLTATGMISITVS